MPVGSPRCKPIPIPLSRATTQNGSRIKKDFPNTPKALIEYNGVKALDLVCEMFNRHKNFFKININIRLDEYENFKYLGYNLLVENTKIGNAGAIRDFGLQLSDPFLVCHNDTYLRDFDAIDFINKHLEYKSLMTLVTKNICLEKERGVVLKNNHNVLGVTRDRFINCGMYCVNHSAIDYIASGFQDIDEDLIRILSAFGSLSCYEYNGLYEDWGR